MHIVHLTPNFYPEIGGIETYVYELSRRMVKKGHKVSVVTSNKLRDGKKLKKFEKVDGINVYRVHFNLVMRYNFSTEAVRSLSKLNYDVLHIHSIGYYTDIISLLKRIKRNKIVVSTHGGIFHTGHMKLVKNVYFNYFARGALKYADRIIATSLKDFKLFSRICNVHKMKLIYPGVNWKILSKLQRGKVKNCLLYVGRFAENKRLERILHVVAKLKKEINDVKLLLVGKDWGEKEKLVRLTRSLGLSKNVKFLSNAKKHYVYYSKANAFLLSSAYEGFGISVLEAMASGLPVVVNDIETMNEMVVNGKNGYIVNFDDYSKIAGILLKLLQDRKLQKRLGDNGKITARKFDWDEIVAKVENVYRI